MPIATPISDWELWACAQQVLRRHSERAPHFVAERLGSLALAGDEAGVSTWQAVARRVSELGGWDTSTAPGDSLPS